MDHRIRDGGNPFRQEGRPPLAQKPGSASDASKALQQEVHEDRRQTWNAPY